MNWQNRLQEAAYTPPSGTRLTFEYEDVGRTIEKRTAAYNFPDADGTYIQDLGHTGHRYPLRLFFWGSDYDIEAAAFEAALLERGAGRLEHPAYGSVDVVPFGDIKRRDDLKTAGNQAIIEVTFWETTGLVYPTGQTDPGAAVLAAVTDFNGAAAAQLEQTLPAPGVVFRAAYQNILTAARAALQPLADAQDDVRRTFDAVYGSITEGIDVLIADPLTLAFQTAILIEAPARAQIAIGARLSAYADLAESIVAGDTTTPEAFFARDVFASAYVAGSVVSAVNTQFETKVAALAAASDILEQFGAVTDWREDNFTAFGEIDTGEAYQQLQEAVALTAGFLVEISFSLKQERRVVLDRARTIVDLAGELYGEIDGQLDFLIASNNLTGSEILELPRGREVVYYV